jgi:hypothetical protein
MKGPDTGTRTNIDQRRTEEQAKAAFERAATILKQPPELQASTGANELPITGHIPLPKSRPIPPPITQGKPLALGLGRLSLSKHLEFGTAFE